MPKINYGYACINLSLGETFKTCKLQTFYKKGLPYISELIQHNLKLTANIIKWNNKNGIKIYRMSSDLFPFLSYKKRNLTSLYELEDLPEIDKIKKQLKIIGNMAKISKQRLTFHPGPFNCLASEDDLVIAKTIADLSSHGKIMDLMGLKRTRYNKINIHIGGSYGNKERTLLFFEDNYKKLLPESVKSRLTLENDDRKNLYAVEDLMELSQNIGVPIVFDTLHWQCHPGKLSYREAYDYAYQTWEDHKVTPVFHHCSSKKIFQDPKATKRSHADYVHENFQHNDKDIDVVLESKQKDISTLKYIEEYT